MLVLKDINYLDILYMSHWFTILTTLLLDDDILLYEQGIASILESLVIHMYLIEIHMYLVVFSNTHVLKVYKVFKTLGLDMQVVGSVRTLCPKKNNSKNNNYLLHFSVPINKI